MTTDKLDLRPVWSALGEIDFMARAIIDFDAMDSQFDAGPTLRRALCVRMQDIVSLATAALEGLDTDEYLKRLQGVTV